MQRLEFGEVVMSYESGVSCNLLVNLRLVILIKIVLGFMALAFMFGVVGVFNPLVRSIFTAIFRHQFLRYQ